MTFFPSLTLAVVQGITEFLPISSDGHLNLVQFLFHLSPSLSFDIFLHAATFLSVIFFFRHSVLLFLQNLRYVFVGTIPIIIIGVFLKDSIEQFATHSEFLPIFFLITSVFVLSTKFLPRRDQSLSYFKAVIIGIFQAAAILPGVSRSALTIFSGLALGLSPLTAFSFSFSLFIPASLGAIILDLGSSSWQNFLSPNYLVSFLVTVIIGYLSLTALKKILLSNFFWLFGIYTFFLGLLLWLLKIG